MGDEATFLNFGAGQQAVVNCPEAMARLLRAACPQQAAGIAAAAHERACVTHDDGRVAFWGAVARILAQAVDAAEQAAAWTGPAGVRSSARGEAGPADFAVCYNRLKANS